MEKGSESVAGDPRGRAAIYSVELEVFEGPLDLLLHLVRRHELDILDIPIAFVAEKYLEYLGMMRALDLEIAGDYLVMAATLAWLKSRELLPVQAKAGEEAGADEEEGEDPREALIRRLVEYERFKNAAAELDALPMSGRDVFARGADIEIPAMDPGLAPVTLFRLAEAYYRVLTRAKINKSHEVTIELVTVAQRMQQLTLMLDERQEFEFEGLFLGRNWSSESELRTMLVVTLMSILELVKLGVARVQQVPDTEAIRIYRLVITEEARQQIEAYDEDQSFGAPVDLGPPQPSEAELDAAEQRILLAEALSGVLIEDADLGPEAFEAPAANQIGPAVVEEDVSEEAGSVTQGADDAEDAEDAVARVEDDEEEELRLLAAEIEALDAVGDELEPEVSLGEHEPEASDAEEQGVSEQIELEAAEVPDALEASEPEEQGADEQTELEAAEADVLEASEPEEQGVSEQTELEAAEADVLEASEPEEQGADEQTELEAAEVPDVLEASEPEEQGADDQTELEAAEVPDVLEASEPEEQGADDQTELEAELRLLAAELEALDAAEAEVAEPDTTETSGLEPAEVPDAPETSEGQGAGEETELDAELRLLAAELEALDAAEAVAEAVTFARGQVMPVYLDAADDADDAEPSDAPVADAADAGDDADAQQDQDDDDGAGS